MGPSTASQPSQSLELEAVDAAAEGVEVVGPLGVLGRAFRPQAKRDSSAWAAVTDSGALRLFFAWEMMVTLVCLLTGSVAVAAYLGAGLPAAAFP